MTSGGFVCPRCDFVHGPGPIERCRRCAYLVDGSEAHVVGVVHPTRGVSSPPTPGARILVRSERPSRAPEARVSLPPPASPKSVAERMPRGILVDPATGMLRTYVVVTLLVVCIAATLFGRVVRMHQEAVEHAYGTTTSGSPTR